MDLQAKIQLLAQDSEPQSPGASVSRLCNGPRSALREAASGPGSIAPTPEVAVPLPSPKLYLEHVHPAFPAPTPTLECARAPGDVTKQGLEQVSSLAPQNTHCVLRAVSGCQPRLY